MEKIICEFEKNRREKIRVSLTEFRNSNTTHQMISARIIFKMATNTVLDGREPILKSNFSQI